MQTLDETAVPGKLFIDLHRQVLADVQQPQSISSKLLCTWARKVVLRGIRYEWLFLKQLPAKAVTREVQWVVNNMGPGHNVAADLVILEGGRQSYRILLLLPPSIADTGTCYLIVTIYRSFRSAGSSFCDNGQSAIPQVPSAADRPRISTLRRLHEVYADS